MYLDDFVDNLPGPAFRSLRHAVNRRIEEEAKLLPPISEEVALWKDSTVAALDHYRDRTKVAVRTLPIVRLFEEIERERRGY